MSILLRSIVGSHLHGLSTPKSDLDYYEVHDLPFINKSGVVKNAIQNIDGKNDVSAVSISQFLNLAMSGSHQALDAMFSENTEVDKITALRKGFYVGYNIVAPYNKLIKKFVFVDDARRQKHAIRLTYNLQDMMESGRFDPRMKPERSNHVWELLNLNLQKDDFISELVKISPYLTIFDEENGSS